MWTALGQHATVLLVMAALAALAVAEFVLVASGTLPFPAANVGDQDPYLWSLYAIDADSHTWATYVAPEYAPAPVPGERVGEGERRTVDDQAAQTRATPSRGTVDNPALQG